MAKLYLGLVGLNGNTQLVLSEEASENVIHEIKVGRSETKHFVEMAEFILENHVADYESGDIDCSDLAEEESFLQIIETMKRGEDIHDIYEKMRRFA